MEALYGMKNGLNTGMVYGVDFGGERDETVITFGGKLDLESDIIFRSVSTEEDIVIELKSLISLCLKTLKEKAEKGIYSDPYNELPLYHFYDSKEGLSGVVWKVEESLFVTHNKKEWNEDNVVVLCFETGKEVEGDLRKKIISLIC